VGKQSPSDANRSTESGAPDPSHSIAKLLEASGLAYFTMTPAGILRDPGRSLPAWLHLVGKDLAGRPFADLLAPGSRNPFEEVLVLLRAQPVASEIHLDLKPDSDLSIIPILLTAIAGLAADDPETIECLARREPTEGAAATLARDEFLHRAMELSPDPVVITQRSKRVVLAVNDAYVQKFDIPRDRVVGRNVDEVGVWLEPEKREEFARQLNANKQVDNLEITHPAGPGRTLKCLMSARVIRIGGQECVLSAIREASSLFDTQDALRRSEERFRAIADYTFDWESWYGTDGRLRWVNAAVERISGLTPKECLAIDDFPLTIIIEEDHSRVAAAFRGALQGTTGIDFEYRIRRKGGEIIWVATSWQPILDADGAVMGHRSSTRDISKRKGAEAALRLSEEKYRYLVNHSLQGILVFQGMPPRPVFSNPAADAISGYTLEEFSRMSAEELSRIVHPRDTWVFDRYYARLQGQDVPNHYEWRLKQKSGEYIWVEMLATKILYGGEPAVQFAIMDITERKRAIDELSRRDRVLEAVGAIAQHLLQIQEFDRALQKCVELLGPAAGVSRCYIFQNSFDDQGRRLCTQRFEWAADGVASFLNDPGMTNLPFAQLGAMESVMSRGDVYYGLVRELSPTERAIMEKQNILAVALVPVFSRDTFWGFLGFDDCVEERQWSGTELDALRAAAGTIGAAVERNRMSIALSESEDRWRSLVHQLPGYVLELDRDGVVHYVNAVVDGVDIADIVGSSLVDLTEEELRPIVRQAIASVLESGKIESVEVRAVANLGPIWYSLQMGPMKNGNDITGVLCIAQDITERKRMESALADSEFRYRRVAEDQTEFIVRWLPDGTRTYANESYCRCFGLDRDAAVGTSFLSLVTEEYRERVLAKVEGLTPENPSATDEHEVTLPDGTIAWQQWIDLALFDQSGKVYEIQSVGRDITDLHRAEEAFRRSEERFRLAFETSPDSININRLSDGMYVDINEGFTRLSGYSREEVLGKTSVELNIWESLEDRRLLIEGIKENGKVDNLEAAFRAKDGSRIIGLMSASLIELGGEPHTVNITRDITDLRAAEQAARDAGENAQRFLDVAATIMIALDNHGRITLINKKGIEILGLPEGDIVGQNWFERFIPEPERDQMRHFYEQLLTGDRAGLDYYENEVICANNEIRLVAWYNTLIRDESGRITGVISSGIDITERSRMERELRLAHEHLEIDRDNLEKKNIALGEILGRIEGEKEAVKQTMIGNIEENILPVIQKVKALGNASQDALFEILEEDLRQITSEFTSGLKQRFHGLTPRQLQICRMIKNGHTSKEIAESLGTSLLTVHKHREAIRDKLGIKNRGINLNSYLQSL